MSETKHRYKVTVRCVDCGEKFVLRGKRDKEGNYNTDFKKCVCGNDERLEVDATVE